MGYGPIRTCILCRKPTFIGSAYTVKFGLDFAHARCLNPGEGYAEIAKILGSKFASMETKMSLFTPGCCISCDAILTPPLAIETAQGMMCSNCFQRAVDKARAPTQRCIFCQAVVEKKYGRFLATPFGVVHEQCWNNMDSQLKADLRKGKPKDAELLNSYLYGTNSAPIKANDFGFWGNNQYGGAVTLSDDFYEKNKEILAPLQSKAKQDIEDNLEFYVEKLGIPKKTFEVSPPKKKNLPKPKKPDITTRKLNLDE